MLEKTRISLEIPVLEKEMREINAKEHGLSMSALFRNGARLLGRFSPGFLEVVDEHYRPLGIQAPVALELTQQRVAAAEAAWLETFGSPPPGVLRQIKYQDGKLIRGDDLSKILKAEYLELFQSMKEKLAESVEEGKPVYVTAEEFSEFAMML